MTDDGNHTAGPSAPGGEPDAWSAMALRWEQVWPPLRPTEEDLALYWEAAAGWMRERGTPRVLLLGGTPELYHLPWPACTDLLAADGNAAMVAHVWPGPPGQVRCVDWLELDLPAGSRDLVLSDGGLDMLPYPRAQQRLVDVIRAVLADAGLCVLRVYALPAQRESPEEVLADLAAGRIRNRAVLQLRLGMALQESAAAGVGFGEIWRAVREAVRDPEALARRLGWAVRELVPEHLPQPGVEAFRFHFLTVEQVRELFCDGAGGFTLESVRVPAYDLGALCPTLVFRRQR